MGEPRGRHIGKAPAKADTRADPVLDYALEHNEQWGVYGGLTAQQRNRLHRAERQAA